MENTFTDEYFMKKALLEAQSAFEKGEVPIGVVVVSDNIIISKSHNLTQTLNDVTAHAEILAITSSSNYLGGKYLKNCKMYITLEPCVMCAGALFWSQIDEIVFGAKDGKRGFQSAGVKLHPKTVVKSGVLENECSQIVKDFFSSKR